MCGCKGGILLRVSVKYHFINVVERMGEGGGIDVTVR